MDKSKHKIAATALQAVLTGSLAVVGGMLCTQQLMGREPSCCGTSDCETMLIIGDTCSGDPDCYGKQVTSGGETWYLETCCWGDSCC